MSAKLKIRCLSENSCSADEAKKLKKMKWSELLKYGQDEEREKEIPGIVILSNEDSIGIELVGEAQPSKDPNIKGEIYETVTNAQNTSLKWLVFELTVTLGLPMSEIYRHPVVSYKNPDGGGNCKMVKRILIGFLLIMLIPAFAAVAQDSANGTPMTGGKNMVKSGPTRSHLSRRLSSRKRGSMV